MADQTPTDSERYTDEDIEVMRFGRGGPLPPGGYEVAINLLRQAAGVCDRAAAELREFSNSEAADGSPDVYTFQRYQVAKALEDVAQRTDHVRHLLDEISSSDVY